MRQRKKARKKYNRIQLYFRPPEFKVYKKRYLEDKTLMPFLILMYNSLDERRLETKLGEAPEQMHSSHKIRENEDINPEWFRYLCSQHITNRVSKRKGSKKRNRGGKYIDTKIQAIHTQEALKNLIKNGYSHSKYFEDYIGIAKELKQQLITEERLYEEECDEERLYEEECDEEIICPECTWIKDLRWVKMKLKNKEDFQVAERFQETEKTLENVCLSLKKDDDIPF